MFNVLKEKLGELDIIVEDLGFLTDSVIKLVKDMSSVSKLCIIPMQDYLGLGKEVRINMPSTLGNNWIYRFSDGVFTDDLAKKIRVITKDYGRL